jgi:hypothetical protein
MTRNMEGVTLEGHTDHLQCDKLSIALQAVTHLSLKVKLKFGAS